MSTSIPNPDKTPHDRRRRICKEYQDALESARDPEDLPKIETYVAQVPEEQRADLLAELIDIDHCCRWMAGTLPTLEEYRKRFPDFANAIEKGFLEPLRRDELRFGLIRELGRGGFGRVFLAKESPSNGWREVAVKVLNEELFKDSDKEKEKRIVARFRQEIATAAKIHHSNIVPVYYSGRFAKDGRFYVVMRYVRGQTLADLIDTGDINLIKAARLMKTIAEAVHAIHEQGAKDCALIHRDLKPSNIFLDDEGKPHVADFGLAATAVQLHFNDPNAGPGGTLSYMSPEQMRAWQRRSGGMVDRRTDVWSLGVIFYEILTGVKPFEGEEDDVVYKVENEPARFPGDFKVPSALEKIIAKCLAKDADERYGTAEELRTHLNRWLQTMSGPDEVRSIPYPPSDFFTGRAGHIASCRESLVSRGRAALCGMAGVGKTQVALAYAQEFQDEYRYVFWLNAANAQNLSTDLAGVASHLDLPQKKNLTHPQVVETVKRWFDDHDGWLLIFDNANDLSMVRDFVPRSGRGHVLLTTWDQTVGGFASKVDVLPLEPETGAVLLLRRAGILRDGNSLDDATAEDCEAAIAITTEVEGLPLALDQAGAYIEATDTLPTEYLELYRQHGAELRRDESGKWSRDYPETVATTWLMAFGEVQAQSPAAADLLRLCSFWAPEGVPEELILAAQPHVEGDLARSLSGGFELGKIVGSAKRLSLLHRNTDSRTIHIHRLVQGVQLDELEKGERDVWLLRAVKTLSEFFPMSVRPDQWVQCERLFPHAMRVVELAIDAEIAARHLARLFALVGRYMLDRTSFRFAEAFLREGFVRLHTLLESELAANSQQPSEYLPFYIQVLTDFAEVLKRTKTANDADSQRLIDSLYERASSVHLLAFGDRSLNYCAVRLAVAARHQERGEFEAATKICGEVLASLPESHELRARALRLLAHIALAQDDIPSAGQFLTDALEICRRVVGHEDPECAKVLLDLAHVRSRSRQYAETEALLREVLRIRRRAFGDDPHYDVAAPLVLLALTCGRFGRHREAQEYFEEALAIIKDAFGVAHEEYHSCAKYLVRCFCEQGKPAKAESFLEQWLEEIGPDEQLAPQIHEMLTRVRHVPLTDDLSVRSRFGVGLADSRFCDLDTGRRPASLDRDQQRSNRVGRNAPCPCGSGRKYKKCCGKRSPDDTKLM